VAEMVEHLSSRHKALSSKPQYCKKKKQKTQNQVPSSTYPGQCLSLPVVSISEYEGRPYCGLNCISFVSIDHPDVFFRTNFYSNLLPVFDWAVVPYGVVRILYIFWYKPLARNALCVFSIILWVVFSQS
jgi:hypothetical protein